MARPFNPANKQWLDDNGDPLSGGKIYSYVAESSTPKATYSDPEGAVPNANPTILNADGEATIYTGTGLYKFVLTDANDVVRWTQDNYDGNPTNAEDGIDGNSVRYGTAAPGPGDGNDGDFWIRTTTNFIYGPKASGTWPSGVSLIGPTGATGATGPAGAAGPAGTPGANGTAKWERNVTGSFSGGNTTYTLTETPTADDEVLAFLNGVLRSDYSVSGDEVTFTGQDTTGQEADFHYRH